MLANIAPTYSNAKILSGIAIRIEETDLPTAIANTVDTSFVVERRNTIAKATKDGESATTFTVVTTIIAGTIYAIARPKN